MSKRRGCLGIAKSESSSSTAEPTGSRFNKRRKVFANYIREIQELLPELSSRASTAEVLDSAIHFITSEEHHLTNATGSADGRHDEVDDVLLDLIDDVVLVVDPTGCIHYASPSCRRHLQFTQYQLMGHSLYEYVFYQNVPDVMIWLNSDHNSKATFRIRCRAKLPSDQDTVWISARKQPVGKNNLYVCCLTILPSNGTTSIVGRSMGPAEVDNCRLIMLHDTNSRAVFVWASANAIAGIELTSLVGLVPGQYHHPDDETRMGVVARDALMRCKPFTDVSRVANPLIGQWLYSMSHMRPMGVVCEDEMPIITTALQMMSIIEKEIDKNTEARLEELREEQDDQPIKMVGTPPMEEQASGSRAMSLLDIDRELLASLGADLLPFLHSHDST